MDDSTYERLVQSVIDYAIYMLDLDGRIVSWNAGAERIKGYSADEIIGEHFSRFYTAEERNADAPIRALELAREFGRFSAEGWRVRKDGSRFWASVVIDPIWEDDAITGFAKITRDVTEHRDASLAALESERRFRILVQGVTDYAIYMLSPEASSATGTPARSALKDTRSPKLSGSTSRASIRPRMSRQNFPGRRWRPLDAKAVIMPRGGGNARTGLVSGPAWSSTPSMTTTAP